MQVEIEQLRIQVTYERNKYEKMKERFSQEQNEK